MSDQPTPLALALIDRIRRDGPLLIADYMDACLHDPAHGYYRTMPAIGASGDFTTAPEISQVFGELIGIWAAVAWRAMGAPRKFRLIELGPGRGTLMADALRAARIVPGFLAAADIHLVDSNPLLRETQRTALARIRDLPPVTWHDSLTPDVAGAEPALIIANEFLDALPIRQIVFTDGAWRERCGAINHDGAFEIVAGAPATPDTLPTDGPPRDGDILETRPALDQVIAMLAHAAAPPMAALLIDYGHNQTGYGDTLQAVRRQHHVSIFETPGQADLTAHVDFAEVARHCRAHGLVVDGPITQSHFLLGLGLGERTEQLLAAARPDQAGLIESGARRIADPLGMGGRFKVACARTTSMPVLPPFAQQE